MSSDDDRLFERAGAALRTPSYDQDAAIDRIVSAVRAEATPARRPRSGALLPWWGALAAAGVAFAVGLGTGRATKREPVIREVSAAASTDSAQRRVEFVFVAPAARNVSVVGDFNGWDASATPMRRTDGRTTWSVAVPLPAGRHVYAFVVDGNAWVADPQAPIAPEQWFGQRNSVVVVPVGDRRS
jgi:hypothetical protein